jgi:hypothetical protein
MTEQIKSGDRVKWTYTHHLNSRSSTRRTKTGTYYGLIRHTVKHWRKPNAEQLACVRFDGNKWTSRVPVSDLRKEDDDD